ncbi:MAG: hypothetical protein ACHP7C_01840 [Lysobacterales bacterium]
MSKRSVCPSCVTRLRRGSPAWLRRSPRNVDARFVPHLSQGCIMREQISEGFMVFVSDGDEGIGSVRKIRHGLPELTVYIENAGDFVVPLSAIKDVHSEKVILDFDRLDLRLRDAIRHARDSEDPNYESPVSTEDEDT